MGEGFAVRRGLLFKVFVAALLTATKPHEPTLNDVGSVRTGTARRQVAYRFGHRLTACYRLGYRGGKPLRHPELFRRQIRASGSFTHSHCALRLNQSSKVLAPTALARYLRRCRSAYGFLRCNRVSASQVPLTPDCCSLHKPNAQQVVLQRLMAPHCTLNAFNRLVLHSRSL